MYHTGKIKIIKRNCINDGCIVSYGKHIDKFVKVDGNWKFYSRIVLFSFADGKSINYEDNYKKE
jgi:hypothetical protein